MEGVPFVDRPTTGVEDICQIATYERQNTDMKEEVTSKLSQQSVTMCKYFYLSCISEGRHTKASQGIGRQQRENELL
jgi:hypothetical protein